MEMTQTQQLWEEKTKYLFSKEYKVLNPDKLIEVIKSYGRETSEGVYELEDRGSVLVYGKFDNFFDRCKFDGIENPVRRAGFLATALSFPLSIGNVSEKQLRECVIRLFYNPQEEILINGKVVLARRLDTQTKIEDYLK